MKKSLTPSKEKLYVGIIHIYLDERDNRPEHQKHLKFNDFTEPTRINDFPFATAKSSFMYGVADGQMWKGTMS